MKKVVSVVGYSGSGKTQLLEGLVPELKKRGYRIAVVKHTHHTVEMDRPGTDSWRLYQAGADVVVLASQGKIFMVKPVSQEQTVADIQRLLGGNYDLIITEGFKEDRALKIEVHRKEDGPGLIFERPELLAVVSDEHLDIDSPQFRPENYSGLADLVERRFLSITEDEAVLYVNGKAVPMNPFIREVFSKILLALLSTLKGVGEVKEMEMWFRTPRAVRPGELKGKDSKE